MNGINAWWEDVPEERFWLGVSRPDREDVVIAVPCGSGRSTASGSHPLIRHVADGDLVFLFDEEREAIVAWSLARGGVSKRRLAGSRPGHRPDPEPARRARQPCWTIRLEPPRALEEVVSLEHIARLQSELFPALRGLEDRVGDPLHYPFALGRSDATHLLAGRVFKLPALFVAACPALARAAGALGPAGRRAANARE